MSPTFSAISSYVVRVAPGLLLGAAVLVLSRKEPRLRIPVYLALFILLRDAMTPLGSWSFGSEGVFWIRLSNDPVFLSVFGVACLALSLGLYYFDAENSLLVHWTRSSIPLGLLVGVAGALVVAAPFLAFCEEVPLGLRGGPVASQLLPPLLGFALLGNLLEELLFRGYVYGYLEKQMTPAAAVLAAAIVFAFCHVYLATTVSDVGYSLLCFTFWEGLVAGGVAAKFGVLPASVTHGGAIFLLSSGRL